MNFCRDQKKLRYLVKKKYWTLMFLINSDFPRNTSFLGPQKEWEDSFWQIMQKVLDFNGYD
jgi:hypothetical protein